jgi:hypothetical protein
MIQFHTYGDSHASEHGGWTRIQIDNVSIVTNWLGPKLMYSFARDKNKIINEDYINNGDYVCFCFGEIDCRVHINKNEPNWKESIDEIVSEYFIAISNNVSNLNVNTCVYNVVPQLERGLPENFWITKWDDDNAHNPSVLPAIGTDEDRVKYSLYMNQKIKEYCVLYGYIFFDIYDNYTNDKGYLNPTYSDANCHIKDPVFIREKLIKIINNE